MQWAATLFAYHNQIRRDAFGEFQDFLVIFANPEFNLEFNPLGDAFPLLGGNFFIEVSFSLFIDVKICVVDISAPEL